MARQHMKDKKLLIKADKRHALIMEFLNNRGRFDKSGEQMVGCPYDSS